MIHQKYKYYKCYGDHCVNFKFNERREIIRDCKTCKWYIEYYTFVDFLIPPSEFTMNNITYYLVEEN